MSTLPDIGIVKDPHAFAIRAQGIGKSYRMYARPEHRLAQFFIGRSKRALYREHWALREVSFDVARGETVGIIGRNGSGKSTLLQILCGTLGASEGNAQIRGRVAALLELGAGFDPEFSGRENVYLAAALYGLTQTQTTAKFAAIEAFAEIGEYIDQPVKTYSSGMYVRLAFSIIANVDADVLVVDEALAVGDIFFTQKCMRFLNEFRKLGTVLFVSHDAASVIALCDRVIWLQNGRIGMIGDAKEVLEQYTQEAFSRTASSSLPEYAIEDPLPDAIDNADEAPIVPEPLPAVLSTTSTPTVSEQILNTRSFGSGGAEIMSASLMREDGNALRVLYEAQRATIRFAIRVHRSFSHPIAGFLIKNRLGQNLFGNNTSVLSSSVPARLEPGGEIAVEFQIELPALSPGDYTIAVAIGEGDHADPLIHHWIHDAIAFRSECAGLSGMVEIAVLRAEIRPQRAAQTRADFCQPAIAHG